MVFQVVNLPEDEGNGGGGSGSRYDYMIMLASDFWLMKKKCESV